MNNKIDWIIHAVMNGVPCGVCGEVENGFIPYTCNCHTHGMEKYDHLDFQMVLQYDPQEIGRILNTLGLRVQSGESFKDGDLVKGIFEDCDVRLNEFTECNRTVLRVIIPDENNRFPEDEGCTAPYKLQMLDMSILYNDSIAKQ
ncbi:MAG: DUF4262 domain-containing protein [Lachnospiraceae bacterium]|nr:DUF4262 domain-containing protein [Lachnospiraceae bacterium]